MNYLKLINTDTGGSRNDVTPIFKDNLAFKCLADDMCRKLLDIEFDYIAGIDALGFILATALAWKLEKGLIVIRKGFKLPVNVERVEFVDYTGTKKYLEVSKNILDPGKKVLLVDEWIETGAQIRAAAGLIESQSCNVAAITAIGFERNMKTEDLFLKYDCRALTDGRIIDLLKRRTGEEPEELSIEGTECLCLKGCAMPPTMSGEEPEEPEEPLIL